ncbi:hypothetical protein [Synechococcus sp. MIT S9509]|uniref:hypothetical protein n=1 Tax=Synechococcus sp. MIT S9509 TaxID=1801630 RepID=UPI00082F067E|nr:hypothetical protein [Synechococcus sp. MIT S9509]
MTEIRRSQRILWMQFRFALEVEAKPQIESSASTATESVLSLNFSVQSAFCPSLPASPVSTASLPRVVGEVDGAGCAI